MHRSKVSFLIKSILICLLFVNKSFEFNIPDQHLILGKLFYYKLNMTKEQKNDVTKIDLLKISDSGPSDLPSWLIFRNFTFIGFPVHQDNIKFISIVINYNKHKTLRDVFLINGIDNQAANPLKSNNIKSNFVNEDHLNNGNCEIKLDKPFETVEDLWRLIVYLMPKFLSEIVSADDQNQLSSNYLKPNPNQAVIEWARDLFTVSGQTDVEGKLLYNLLISNQPCARDLNDYDDIQYKLTKIGVQFNVVKNVQNLQESADDDDEDNQFFNPDSKLMLNDMSPGKNRRQIKRINVYSTPALYPNWMTVSATQGPSAGNEEDSTFNRNLNNNLDTKANDLTRIQPSLSTPDLPTRTASLYVPVDHNELTTPHYPASVLANVYSTPSFAPEPPTDYLSTNNLITPTPTLTFIVSDTAKEFSLSNSNLESIISPSSTLDNFNVISSIQPNTMQPTDQLPTLLPDHKQSTSSSTTSPSTTFDDLFRITSSTTTTTAKPTTTTTKKPKVYSGGNANLPDHAPMIKERIPKLRLTSGVYWRYIIPEDTFADFEKGNTRNLELSFAPIDNQTENIAPADLFIQFDRENQILTALPTEDHIGRHKFQLTAADSLGQMVSDELELSVVQHKLSRSFTHKLMLENVVWNANTPLVEAVYNLMKKIAILFKDRSVDSIFLQKVEVVKNDQPTGENRVWNIYWTNSSLRTYPCPSQEIQQIFNTLASNGHKYKENEPAHPSQLLRKTIEPEYQIGQIRYSLASTCSRIDTNLLKDKTPLLRNPIKNITFEIGSVFNYQVPSDTFISSKQTNTRDLALELVSPSGYIVDKKDCIGFVSENQTIYGLALSEKLIDENLDYRLIARDLDSNLNAYDIFVLQILADRFKNQYTHEITLQFKSNINIDMDLYSKVTIANKFANAIFDGDLNNLRVLRIKQNRYETEYKSNYDFNRRKKRSLPSKIFYEYVLSNTRPYIASACPADQIQRNIVTPIFNVSNVDPEARLAMLKELFLPDYELAYVSFRPIGKCKNQIAPTYIGSKLIASKIGFDELITTTEPSLIVPTEPSIGPTSSNREDEVLLRTIVPALLIIIIILLISCLVIVMLVRFRRSHDKNRFDVNPNMHGGEAESFLQKGRTPVILQSDLNPSMHLLHQQQVYNQMTPMKQFNRNNPYTAHEPQRRPPPAYMNLNN